MFSGIIDNEGVVVKKQSQGGQVHFVFQMKKHEKRLRVGESIAVDGVCLTAVKITGQRFEVDVVRETLRDTTLGDLKVGDPVNLERSLKYGDPVSGHFVTGHVDARGTLKKIEKDKKNCFLTIEVPKRLIRFIAMKGSVALDGISLTIQELKGKTFSVAIIPHTFNVTTLRFKKAGSGVNIEIDQTARYLKKAMTPVSQPLSLEALKEQGF